MRTPVIRLTRTALEIACLGAALIAAGCSTTAPHLTAPPPATRFPLDARLAPDGKVIVRNTTPLAGRQGVAMTLQALVLRRVQWSGQPASDRQWTTLRAGAVTERADGTLLFKNSPVAPGVLPVENGLLFPGEELTVTLPPDSRHELVVQYAAVAPGKDWADEVLLRVQTAGPLETYAPATAETITARRAAGGGPAVVRARLHEGDDDLKVLTATFSLSVLSEHHLTWRGYDGSGDAATAQYLLDDVDLGRGPAGVNAVRERLKALPAGSRVLIVPYYGDPGSGRAKKYPFDLNALVREAAQGGVALSAAQGE